MTTSLRTSLRTYQHAAKQSVLASSRAEAVALGVSRYFTGKPCKNGHVSFRTIRSHCTECLKGWRPVDDAARNAAWRAANPERVKENNRRNYEKNAEAYRAYARQWKRNNPTAYREWCRANPDRLAAVRHRRQALIADHPALSAQDIADIRALQGDRCAECQRKVKLTIDHIVPVSKGGTGNRRNIQLLCGPCNSSKKDADPIVFSRRKGRLL